MHERTGQHDTINYDAHTLPALRTLTACVTAICIIRSGVSRCVIYTPPVGVRSLQSVTTRYQPICLRRIVSRWMMATRHRPCSNAIRGVLMMCDYSYLALNTKQWMGEYGSELKSSFVRSRWQSISNCKVFQWNYAQRYESLAIISGYRKLWDQHDAAILTANLIFPSMIAQWTSTLTL